MEEHKVVIEQDLMKRVIVQVLKNQAGLMVDNDKGNYCEEVENIKDTQELLAEFED